MCVYKCHCFFILFYSINIDNFGDQKYSYNGILVGIRQLNCYYRKSGVKIVETSAIKGMLDV